MFRLHALIGRFGDCIVHIHFKDARVPVFRNVRTGDLSFNAGVRSGMLTVPGDGFIDVTPIAHFATMIGR